MHWLTRFFQPKPIEETHAPSASPLAAAPRRRSALPADWRTNEPYLAVLQRFSSMRDAEHGVPEYWESMFGSSPEKIVTALMGENALVEASLLEKIEFCHTGADLKELLSARALKVSGRKAEQAQRLFDADPSGMQQLCGPRRILGCSEDAAQAVADWIRSRTEALDRAADKVIAALKKREFGTAIRVADAYKKTRFETPVHPGQEALTIQITPQPVEKRAEEVKRWFTMRPRILKQLSSSDWEGLYLDYGVWQLLGTSFPEKCMPDFPGSEAMDAGTVVRMLHFHIGHMKDVMQWKELGIAKAKLSCCHSGSCDACMSLDGKTFRLDQLPQLPYEFCSCQMGCRCLYLPEINF